MKLETYNTAKQHLLSAFNHLAPTSKEQRALIACLVDAEQEGASHQEMLDLIVSSITDGLRYGNWPTHKSVS